MANQNTSADYVIVGAGSAGCAIAARLTEKPNVSVLLVEAGPADNSPLIANPIGTAPMLQNSLFGWKYKTAAEPGFNNRSLDCPRGKVMGGTSSINGMLYVRGNRADYEEWRAAAGDGWGYDDVLPFFRKSENFDGPPDQWHGSMGPLQTTKCKPVVPLDSIFLKACTEAGLPENHDFNGADQTGAGWHQHTITHKGAKRASASRTFLREAKGRPNLTIHKESMVRRIVWDGKRAVGVEVETASGIQTLRANKEVVLAAGAIGSPHILQHSGVGDGDHLKSLGIDVVAENKEVGLNLVDHPDVGLWYKCTQPVSLNGIIGNPIKLLGSFARAFLTGTGPLAGFVFRTGAFITTREDEVLPDIQISFAPLYFERDESEVSSEDGFGLSICLLKPKSRGHIKIQSQNPNDAPEILFNYCTEQDDVVRLREGLKKTREIIGAPAFANYRGLEISPGDKVQSDVELDQYLRDEGQTVYHPVGSARMGTDANAVVDPRLRVRHVEGLRIADASIMPTIPRANTNAACIMIGEKAAELILQDR